MCHARFINGSPFSPFPVEYGERKTLVCTRKAPNPAGEKGMIDGCVLRTPVRGKLPPDVWK